MDQQDALPPLPEPAFLSVRRGGFLTKDAYTADQMRAAILAERARCAAICRSRYMGDNTREDMEARACAEAIERGVK